MELRAGHSATVDGLTISLPRTAELLLTGTLSGDSAHAAFGNELDKIHAHVMSTATKLFVVDVRGLNFVTSSAIRVFVNWISKAERGGYRLTFRVDANITWHRLSFSVLKSLAPRTVEIDMSGGRDPGDQGHEAR